MFHDKESKIPFYLHGEDERVQTNKTQKKRTTERQTDRQKADTDRSNHTPVSSLTMVSASK